MCNNSIIKSISKKVINTTFDILTKLIIGGNDDDNDIDYDDYCNHE